MAKKIAALALCLLMVNLFSPTLVQAQATEISGKVLTVTPKGGDLFEISIATKEGTAIVLVNGNSLIEAASAAKGILKGHRILPAAKGDGANVSWMPKLPFQDVTAANKKLMGLPDLGKLPDIQKPPKVPGAEDLPKLPEIPKPPALPKLPKAPPKATVGAPAPGPMPGPEMAAEGAGGGNEEGEQQAPAKKKEEFETVKPEKDSLSKLIPNALGAATAEAEKDSAAKVLEVKTSEKEVLLKVEGPGGAAQEVKLSPEDKVMRLLEAGELKADMTVRAEVAEKPEGKVVVRMTVL